MRSPVVRVALGALCCGVLAQGGNAGASVVKFFQSPTKNIGCAADNIEGWRVRCDIGSRTWPTPKRPGSCPLDYGNGVELGTSGRGRYVCAGDTSRGVGPVLAYGRSRSIGPFTCTSRRSGMRCVNRRNSHGFDLSASRVRLF